MELLLSAGMLLVVLVGVSGLALSFNDRAAGTGEVVAAQEAARDAVSGLTFELRSAGPTSQGVVLLRAGPSDLAFASDSLREAPGQWRAARYCWDGQDVIRQVRTTLVAPGASCPDSSWGSAHVVARDISGPLFTYSEAVGATPTVTVTMSAAGARPLQSAVTIRNRALGADAIACDQTNANNALLTLTLGVGQTAEIPVKIDDLVGLKALLFGASTPPASWECP
ncbi:MAG: hypothetical protein RIB67_09325 [Miltoncostaeaceae bacterium]